MLGIPQRLSTGLLLLLLLLHCCFMADTAPAVEVQQQCPPGTDRLGPGCCSWCPPGRGLLTKCHRNVSTGELVDTVCQDCSRQQKTFSSVASATSNCERCRPCRRLERVAADCSPAADTVCHCIDGHHRAGGVTSDCRPCSKCSRGQGRAVPCGQHRDTVCRNCTAGAEFSWYSVRLHSFVCRVCGVCPTGHVTLANCTAAADTRCRRLSDGRALTATAAAAAAAAAAADASDGGDTPGAEPKNWRLVIYNGDTASSSRFNFSTNSANDGSNAVAASSRNDLIPVYCGLLGAVIVAVTVWMVYKYLSRRGADRKAEAQAANPLMLPPSAQQQQQQLHRPNSSSEAAAAAAAASAAADLSSITSCPRPLHSISDSRFQRLVNILSNCADPHGWRQLAAELGFQEAAIADFEAESDSVKQSPIQLMLRKWSDSDDATVGALAAALVKVDRRDALILFRDSQRHQHQRQHQRQSQSHRSRHSQQAQDVCQV